MAKTRDQKEQIVANLKETYQKSKTVVFAEYSGLTMGDMEGIRNEAKKDGMKVTVAKKSLSTLAAHAAGFEDVDANNLPNSVMTVFGFEDEVAPARLVADFIKNHEDVSIVGGVFEGAFASSEQMIALSKLPSKEELYAKLVGSLNSPISGFVNVLSGNLRGLVTALKQIQEQKA